MDNINERWMPCPHYEDKYQISTYGRLQNINTGKYIIGSIKKDGYCRVCLTNKYGKKCTEYIHRLVALAFIPNPNNLPCVNHKDEVKHNNFVGNLEWCSYSYNNNYGTKNQRGAKSNTNNPYWSKPVRCVETNIVYPSIAEAQRQTGIWKTNIVKVLKGERKTTGGYHWKYEV